MPVSGWGPKPIVFNGKDRAFGRNAQLDLDSARASTAVDVGQTLLCRSIERLRQLGRKRDLVVQIDAELTGIPAELEDSVKRRCSALSSANSSSVAARNAATERRYVLQAIQR